MIEKWLLKFQLDANSIIVGRNIIYSAAIKIVNFIVMFLSIPLLIDYLTPEKYGIWITLISLSGWLNMTDFGLGNGLRNKLVEYISVGNLVGGQQVVSIVYSLILGGCLFFCFIFYFLAQFISWNKVFNVHDILCEPLLPVVLIFGFATLFILFFKLVYNIFYAYQQNFIVNLIDTSVQFIAFIILWAIKFYSTNLSLLQVTFLFLGIQIILLIIVNIIVFSISYKDLKPRIGFFPFSTASSLLKLSGAFLGVQLVGWFMYMSDNFLITQLFGNEEVTKYNIAYRYFAILGVVWGLSYTNIWTMTTKSFAIKNFDWIKKIIKIINIGAIVTFFLASVLYLLANNFFALWVGSKVSIPSILNLSVALYWCLNVFSQGIFSVTNGMGKMRLQFILNAFLSVLNIIIALFLSKYTSLGVASVPIATACCIIIQLVFTQIQCYKIINNNAFGIWNR